MAFAAPTTEMARPRKRLGNISENIAHITGPNEIEKPVINPKMLSSTHREFIFIPSFNNIDLYKSVLIPDPIAAELIAL